MRASAGTSRASVIRPIAADDIAEAFACFEPFKHIVLAVSGGPDSIALMLLAREWAKMNGRRSPKFSVATINHGLRIEAGREALLVARFSKSLRMPHETLMWSGVKPKTGLQEKAREARYGLLLSHAREIGAEAIALAHHADDQAETLLMRLASGSGLSGLSGMKGVSQRDGMPLLRPLLDMPAERLRATLDARSITYIDDPSNHNEAYARVRIRKARDVLAEGGLTRERLQMLARRMARADSALSKLAAEALHRHAMPMAVGRIFAPSLFGEPAELLIRVLHMSISEIGHGQDPMLHRLENSILSLSAARASGKSMKLTIGGSILTLSADGRLKILPESPRRKV